MTEGFTPGGRRRRSLAPEEEALMSPPFIGVTLREVAAGFHRESGEGLPVPLAFVAVPLVLTAFTRDHLPNRRNSSLAAWVQEHARLRLTFATSAHALVPAVRRGLIFGINKSLLDLEGAGLRARRLRRGSKERIEANTEEVRVILGKALFVGRWFVHAGSPDTVMTLLGVRP